MDPLRFENLTRAYGARTIFAGVSGTLRGGTTVGLVGPNGAGKSSLVRILVGAEEPDGGTVVRPAGVRVGYVSQSANADDGSSLRSLLERAFVRERALHGQLRASEVQISAAADSGDAPREARALARYAELRDTFERHGGFDSESRLRGILVRFGFDGSDLERPLSVFSGGQRTRASLARLLLEEPDVLILDEPTNHLDLEAVRRLEDILVEQREATLVVSHDRSFLDRVADQIWDLDGGTLERYDVPRGRAYAAFLEARAERRAQAVAEYERFRAEEERRKAVVAELRTHGSHNYAQVRSREKQLGKLERVAPPRTSQASISVTLEAARRATGGLALRARRISAAYAAPLFTDLSLDVRRGERLVVAGPNGAGKSTLLDVLASRRPPDHGDVRLMDGVRAAYFAQDSVDELPRSGTAVEAVEAAAPLTGEQARGLLGRLGLGGDAGDKPLNEFSGGERRRIMLACLMARAADLLFLDEPTNDLDIPSREALEAVLAHYGGAMIVISHDRYLLRRLGERVLWLQDGRATVIERTYEAFERELTAGSSAVPAKPAAAPPAPRAAGRERDQRLEAARDARALAACEREVAQLDEERARLEREFADPGIYADPQRVAALQSDLAAASAAVDAAFARWEALSAKREAS
ncbi:MAG: ABC-F family ATP-binding cassette domain-containing protein [Candidatus Eremiobacteraeota bacterium]|nr:ABC-F family ATP-binding cassette domain-containing protein [Candidatus Eremiobacteraeota bacterium]MBC5822480.1 ABC-F family ATP-binding cassette domain-containing protein [Candidatus Eremiobacteraeota bacterium]